MAADVPAFEELLSRLRRGDADAAQLFVSQYEPYVRRAIRPRIARYGLSAAFDSADVCQSVLASFLIRVAAGQYQLSSSADLERLLLAMMRRKMAHLARREFAQRRDRHRLVMAAVEYEPESAADSAEAWRAATELLDRISAQLDADNRELFTLRRHGHDWETIAARVGMPSALLRKRLSRALRRVVADLQLE